MCTVSGLFGLFSRTGAELWEQGGQRVFGQAYCSLWNVYLVGGDRVEMNVREHRKISGLGRRGWRRPGRVHTGSERGQSLVELALVVPLLLLLLVGIIEIGRFAYYSILVSNAARAGAQYGAQSLATAADAAGIVTAATSDAGSATGLTITSQQRCGCDGAGLSGACPAAACALPNHALVYVQVKAVGAFPSLFRYPGLPATINVTTVEEMRVAQ